MNFNIINKRIEFSNKAQYLMYTYQATINKEVLFKRIKPTIAETYIKRKNINYFNYQLFMNLSFYKYKKVLPLYQSIMLI
jgi:IS4 transposase